MVEKIAASMLTKTLGFAAVLDGIVNIRTVSDTAQAAAFNMMHIHGVLFSPCNDPKCDCTTKALNQVVPGAKIVPVEIVICEEGK